VGDADKRQVLLDAWADCGWSAGPFVFYGDPELLARVRATLGDAAAGRPWRNED
jgi:hypothetical protein